MAPHPAFFIPYWHTSSGRSGTLLIPGGVQGMVGIEGKDRVPEPLQGAGTSMAFGPEVWV